ncbi:MAG: hypothetical protein WKF86_05955 [Acidimicrobiales bacterium]
MARRTRTARRRLDPSDFLDSDGWRTYILDGTVLLPSLAAAQEAWEVARPETWRAWLEAGRTSLPMAAVAHDGLVDGPADAALEALEDFRRRRPRTAEQIAGPLEAYEAQLRARLDRASPSMSPPAAAGL